MISNKFGSQPQQPVATNWWHVNGIWHWSFMQMSHLGLQGEYATLPRYRHKCRHINGCPLVICRSTCYVATRLLRYRPPPHDTMTEANPPYLVHEGTITNSSFIGQKKTNRYFITVKFSMCPWKTISQRRLTKWLWNVQRFTVYLQDLLVSK